MNNPYYTNILFEEATSGSDYFHAVDLFREYAEAIGIDLSFQNFEEELGDLKKEYSRPLGVLLLAKEIGKAPIGCAGIRKFELKVAELKRMYVKPSARGQGIGKILLQKSVEIASELGYTKVRLDTLPCMQSATCLYEKEGFYQIRPYRYNPIEGAKYYEKNIA